jgi:hypothetical protein
MPAIIAEVKVPVITADVLIQAIIAFFFSDICCSRSNLNVRDLPLGLREHIETRVIRTQETRVTR